MSLNIKVRPCVPEDAPILARFNMDMALETEGKNLDYQTVHDGCKNLILKPKYGMYIMCDLFDSNNQNPVPIGCTLASFEMNARLGGLIYMI